VLSDLNTTAVGNFVVDKNIPHFLNFLMAVMYAQKSCHLSLAGNINARIHRHNDLQFPETFYMPVTGIGKIVSLYLPVREKA